MAFIPEGAIINKRRYKGILHRLRSSIRCKRPELWRKKNWLLLHDDAFTHLVQEMAKQQMTKPHSTKLFTGFLPPLHLFLLPIWMFALVLKSHFYPPPPVLMFL
jgi:hypothetical protein